MASRQAVAQGMRALLAAIEELAADGTRPVVAACWQDEAYLDVPPGLLDRLATIADLTIACSGRPRLRAEVCHVEVEPDETITDEWSLVALTPTAGVALVAHEVAASLPAGTVEGGRAFRYDTTDDLRVVVAHARRLQRSFGARMEPTTSASLSAAIAAVADDASTGSVDILTAPVHDAIATADDARRESSSVPPSGAGGLAGLAQWLADAGPRSPSLGMVVVRAGAPGVTAELRRNAHAIGRVGDIIVDVPPDAAMIVLPGLDGAALQERADEVCSLLAGALATGDVDACAVEVPAEHARRDLVGSLGAALAQLRTRQGASS